MSNPDSTKIKDPDSTQTSPVITSSRNNRAKSVNVYFRVLPNAALNYQRLTLVSDHSENTFQYELNSKIQKYIDANMKDTAYPSVLFQANEISSLINNHNFNFGEEQITNKDIYYATLRSRLVSISDESELNTLITQATSEMMNNNMGDLSNDLLPFITMLMNEQHLNNYDFNRTISTKPEAKGIVTSTEMLNTMGTLDPNNVLGVCRDTHDMGLRIARNMYQVYLDQKYPDKHYDVDDYVFLQAWVTPSSQHITLVVVDPENPRNFHELDWGRVIQKTDQEGIAIGKMVGPAIRLWQYDEKNDRASAFNLVRSQWGAFLDKEILNTDEQWMINGIYNREYSSGTSYKFGVSKKSKAIVTAGVMNTREPYLSASIRSGKHKINLTRFLTYDGFATWQSMYINDTFRKNNMMPWADWSSADNLITSVRYISGLKTKPIQVTPNFNFTLYAKSQFEVFLTMSYLVTDHVDFQKKFYSSGDGNLWTTWGGEFAYVSPSKNYEVKLSYNDRSFIIPNDVRLLSPNPFVLFGNATAQTSARGLRLLGDFSLTKGALVAESRFEQDALNSKFIYGSVGYKSSFKTEYKFNIMAGYYDQVSGLEYYWYNKSRVWLSASLTLPEKLLTFGIYGEAIENDSFSTILSISKSF